MASSFFITVKKVRLASIAALAAIVVFAIYVKQYFLIMGVLATSFAANAAFMSDDPNQDYGKKNRSVAMALSKIPAAGQFYLRDLRKALIFLSVYPACLALLMLIYEFRTDALFLLGNFFAFVFLSVFASGIDVEMICNKQGLPYLNSAREFRIKNYHKAYVTLVVLVFLFICLITVLGFVYMDNKNIWIYLIAFVLWASGVIVAYFGTRTMSGDNGVV